MDCLTSGASDGPSILMLGNVVHAHEDFQRLHEVAKVIHINSGVRQDFLAKCKNGELDQVVAISRTVESAQNTGLFDAQLIEVLPSSVKFISHNGAGYDQINIKACAERGITVSNTPGSVDFATADIAMFLMIGALRRAWIPMKAVRAGNWRGNSPLGRDPSSRLLGILGMGGIGTAMAQRASAFGFHIQYHNRKPVENLEKKLGSGIRLPRYVGFDELIRTSDIISINLPLTPNTQHIIGKEQFKIMKQGVIIINTARGAIIDEQALLDALRDKDWISSVGLDVYEHEPEIDKELLENERVMLLPHIGTATYDTQKQMEIQTIDNIIHALQKGYLLNPVLAN